MVEFVDQVADLDIVLGPVAVEACFLVSVSRHRHSDRTCIIACDWLALGCNELGQAERIVPCQPKRLPMASNESWGADPPMLRRHVTGSLRWRKRIVQAMQFA